MFQYLSYYLRNFREYYLKSNIKPDLPEHDFKVPMNVAMGYFFVTENKKLKEKFDQIYEWWFNDVARFSNDTDFLKSLLKKFLEKQSLEWKIVK